MATEPLGFRLAPGADVDVGRGGERQTENSGQSAPSAVPFLFPLPPLSITFANLLKTC